MTQPGEKQSRLYGRRKGKPLSARKARLIETLLPALRFPVTGDASIDPGQLFSPVRREIWLEIGFGGGEHLAWQARENPDTGMIGCEPFINGIAKLLGAIEDNKLENIRIHPGDARELLHSLESASLERIFLLYPDPWPKTRHHKRRFVSQETLSQMHRLLKPGGLLRIASDIDDYIRWSLAAIHRHGGFEWLANEPDDWQTRPDDWPQTRYEEKALREGRKPTYLEFERI